MGKRLPNFEYMDMFYTKRLAVGAHLQNNYIYLNDGPSVTRGNDLSRTALAHKVMFDFCESEISIFARGLHRNIYSTEVVREAFRNYVKRVILPENSNVEPIDIICREHGDKEKLLGSPLVKEAKKLAEIYGKTSPNKKIIRIYDTPKKDVAVRIIRFFEEEKGDGTIVYSRECGEIEEKAAGNLSAFCIFGGCYRFRRINGEKAHYAYINFGDTEILKLLRFNFNQIRSQCSVILEV